MRFVLAMVLGLGCAVLPGCLNTDSCRNKSNQPIITRRPATTEEDAVQLLVAVIERPAGDSILNEDVWKLTDEQMKDLDKKSTLADNGFRIGMIGPAPPPCLRDLIQSPRSCTDPRRIRVLAGSPTEIKVGPEQPSCVFHLENLGGLGGLGGLVIQGDLGGAGDVQLDKAECLLQLEATRQEDGQIELRFTPLVRHGKPGLDRQPITEPGGIMRWNTTVHQKVETYSPLSWTQTVGDRDYLIIGCWPERCRTLGQKMFLDDHSPGPVQRLLVVRAVQDAQETTSLTEETSHRTPTIATQAGVPVPFRSPKP